MEPFIGQIVPVAFNFAPRGYAICEGQTMAISQNTALFALIGTTYGGNGTSTFLLPDLRGRVAVGYGQGPGLANVEIGEAAGSTLISLTTANLPPHTHVAVFTPMSGAVEATGTLTAVNAAGTQKAAAEAYLANPANGPTQYNAYVSSSATGAVKLDGVSVSVPVRGGTVTNSITGSGTPFDAASPYLAINYVIAVYGVYPSRN